MHDRRASPARGVAAHPVRRLWRTLVRLALFQADSAPARTRISPNDTDPALAWIHCHLLATHDHVIRSAPGRMFLECQRCGARSRGWDVGSTRYAMPPRAAVRTVSLVSADPIPAAAGDAPSSAPFAGALARLVTPAVTRRTGRVLIGIRRPVAVPAHAWQAAELEARALGATAGARLHASRDPPCAWRP